MLDVEELISALSSSMCPDCAVVAYILTVVMQTLLVPATRYARILDFMLTHARQRNILPARSPRRGLVEGPDSAPPPSAQTSEHLMPLQTDIFPLANPIYQQLMEPDSGDRTIHHQQAQSHMIPTSGLQPPHTSSRLPNPPSSIPPFETQMPAHATVFGQQPFEGGE